MPSFSTLCSDLDGKNLSRIGAISSMTQPTETTTLLMDVHTLGGSAFTPPGANGQTLTAGLEDPATPKHLWDVPNGADAFWAHDRGGLADVTNVQLLPENACRAGDETCPCGLDVLPQKDLGLRFVEEEAHFWRGFGTGARAEWSRGEALRTGLGIGQGTWGLRGRGWTRRCTIIDECLEEDHDKRDRTGTMEREWYGSEVFDDYGRYDGPLNSERPYNAAFDNALASYLERRSA